MWCFGTSGGTDNLRSVPATAPAGRFTSELTEHPAERGGIGIANAGGDLVDRGRRRLEQVRGVRDANALSPVNTE